MTAFGHHALVLVENINHMIGCVAAGAVLLYLRKLVVLWREGLFAGNRGLRSDGPAVVTRSARTASCRWHSWNAPRHRTCES